MYLNNVFITLDTDEVKSTVNDSRHETNCNINVKCDEREDVINNNDHFQDSSKSVVTLVVIPDTKQNGHKDGNSLDLPEVNTVLGNLEKPKNRNNIK